jgi:hypothetical protein
MKKSILLDPIPVLETCQEEEEEQESDKRGLKSEVSSLEEPRQCDGLGLDDLDAFSIGGLDSISMSDHTAPLQPLLATEQVLFEEGERVPSVASVSALPIVSADDVEVCVCVCPPLSLSLSFSLSLSLARARALSLSVAFGAAACFL